MRTLRVPRHHIVDMQIERAFVRMTLHSVVPLPSEGDHLETEGYGVWLVLAVLQDPVPLAGATVLVKAITNALSVPHDV